MRRSPWHRLGILPVAALTLLLFAIAVLAASGVLYPDAKNTVTYAGGGLKIDASNSSQGYFMAKYTYKDNKKLKLRVSNGNDQWDYDLRTDGVFEVFPLQNGTGTYRVTLYKNTSGNRYSQAFSASVKAKIANENLAFLYPNQYVNFNADSRTVALAQTLCENAKSDADKFDAIYAYVTRNIVYDYFLALTVKKGYLPSVDDTIQSGKGICFDYAAVMACMLRTQGVPTKLCIGYADKTYHAWNSVLIGGEWTLADATFATTGAKPKQYTLERCY